MKYIVCKKNIVKKLLLTSSSLNIKESNLSTIIEELCDKVLEFNKIIKNINRPLKSSLGDLLKQLYSLEEKFTKKEKAMLFIFKESINNRVLFLNLIKKRLSLIKKCTTQEALNITRDLNKQNLISIIKKCSRCNTKFNILPSKCENCGHIFF